MNMRMPAAGDTGHAAQGDAEYTHNVRRDAGYKGEAGLGGR